MQELSEWMEYIEDKRQQRKVRHTLKDILVIVSFATLANADDWVEMALFAEDYQDYLRKYIELKNGHLRPMTRSVGLWGWFHLKSYSSFIRNGRNG